MTSTLPITDDELPALFAGLERVPLALAVSGGADSMALMHMIARWAAREDVRAAYADWWAFRVRQLLPHILSKNPPKVLELSAAEQASRRAAAPPHVVVLTVDHGLRSESAEEAAFVATQAQALDLPCRILHWEGEKPATGIQNAAREARRALLVAAIDAEAAQLVSQMQEHGVRLRRAYRTLVLAHHLEDQAETFLMRLARGSGLDGLLGMREVDFVNSEKSGQLGHLMVAAKVPARRPLLGVPKARLVATMKSYAAAWVEDPSNADERFERVRVRNALRQLEPLGITADKIALSARRLADVERPFVGLVEKWVKPDHLGSFHEVYAELEIDSLLFTGSYFGVRTLRQLILVYGGASRPPELSQLEALYRIAITPEHRVARNRLTLGGCVIEFRSGRKGATIRVHREGRGEGLPAVPVEPGQWTDWDGRRFMITAKTDSSGGVVRALGMQGWADLKRGVKGLGDLGWPAAAVATLPVVEHDSAIVAYPAIDSATRRLPDDFRKRWIASGLANPGYKAVFRLRDW